MKLLGIRAAAIDLDGTMVDTARDFEAAINLMLADLDLPPVPLQTVLLHVGKGTEHLVRGILAAQTNSLTESLFESGLQRYHARYERINGQHSVLFPQVEEGLIALREAGLRLACVTNKPHRFALALLQQKNLHTHFELIYGGDSLARKKPDPLPMQQVCADFSIEPRELLALGDSSNDAQAARAAGCPVLLVPYGYNHGEDVASVESDGIVATLLDAASRLAA